MKEAYIKAKHNGERAYKKALSSGNYPFLTDLDHVLYGKTDRVEKPVGQMDIPLQMITGTKNQMRGESFACNFMPLLPPDSEFAIKWSLLYEAQQNEGIRDPVKVYEYLHRFYVVEGNKRVSVLRYLNAPVIQAEVTRIMPLNDDDPDIAVYYEFLEFFGRAPIYELQFSKEGDYRKLEKMIGIEEGTVWPPDLVKMVKSAFYCFEEIYLKREHYHLSVSDAFLIFLSFYPIGSLLENGEHEIKKMMDRIRKILYMKVEWGDEDSDHSR